MKYERSFNLTLAVTLLLAAGGFTLVSATNVPPSIAATKSSTPKQTSRPSQLVEPTEHLQAFNAPPIKGDKVKQEEQPLLPNESNASMVAKEKATTEPLASSTVKSGLAVAQQTNLRVKDSKPIQVTGFITKSGNIYEIEDKDGIGRIEGRQTGDEEATVVCNYGSVVIYSDVPCDQVTSVHIRDIQQQPIDFNQPAANADVPNQTEAAPIQNETNALQANATEPAADNQNKDELANDTATETKPRRQGQRIRQQQQKQQQNKRRRNRYNGNANRRRRVQANGNRRRQDQLQNTRRQGQPNRQRVQYQNGSSRPNNRKPVKRNQQKRRRQQQQKQQKQQKRRRQQSSQQYRRQQQQQQRRQQQQQQQQRKTYNNYDEEFESDF